MRMEDADQVQARGTSLPIGCQQVFRTQLIACSLSAGVRIFEWHRQRHLLPVAVNRPDHRAAALVWKGNFRVRDHHVPSSRLNVKHAQSSSSQKGSLRYFVAPSHSIVTIKPPRPSLTSRRPTSRAAWTLAPEL